MNDFAGRRRHVGHGLLLLHKVDGRTRYTQNCISRANTEGENHGNDSNLWRQRQSCSPYHSSPLERRPDSLLHYSKSFTFRASFCMFVSKAQSRADRILQGFKQTSLCRNGLFLSKSASDGPGQSLISQPNSVRRVDKAFVEMFQMNTISRTLY